MRIGLQVTPERARYADKVDRLVADARAAEESGFATAWVPQIPDEFDALTALALMARGTERIELATAVLPIQSRHPVAMAQQALSTQVAAGGRLTLGIGASHHWIVQDMLGLPYDKPLSLMRDYLEVLNRALAGPGVTEVSNASFSVKQPFDITDRPVPLLLAALAPRMLELAGAQASGTILWLADAKSIADYIVPTIGKAAADAGRPSPRIIATVPATLCSDAEVEGARAWAAERLGHAEFSPNYQRLLQHGEVSDIDELLMAGSEAEILARVKGFHAAGVTDLAIRVLPYGSDQAQRIASRERTTAYLASLAVSSEFGG
jgi:F420-dependent oxidoreductase-like protein